MLSADFVGKLSGRIGAFWPKAAKLLGLRTEPFMRSGGHSNHKGGSGGKEESTGNGCCSQAHAHSDEKEQLKVRGGASDTEEHYVSESVRKEAERLVSIVCGGK